MIATFDCSYDPAIGRFISADSLDYLDPHTVGGVNLYAYCNNNPVNYSDPSGHMPKWAQWIIGGLAVVGLATATLLTCGVLGVGAVPVGAAMLTGGLVSAGINVVDQLHDGGPFNWTELAISAFSGVAYGLVLGLSGGTVAGTWSWSTYAGKLAVAGGTSLLNSWNENKSAKETIVSFASSLMLSTVVQGLGRVSSKIISQIPKDSTKFLTIGDIGSYLWGVPAIKVGAIRFASGVAGSIANDY